MSVCVCVCLFVCAIAKHPKDISLIMAYNDTILLIFSSFIDFKLLNYLFFLFLSYPSVDKPIVDNGKVRRGRFVDVVIIVSDK